MGCDGISAAFAALTVVQTRALFSMLVGVRLALLAVLMLDRVQFLLMIDGAPADQPKSALPEISPAAR